MASQQITVSTTVPVLPASAWKFYTSADDVIQWNFANDEWRCPSATIDLRVGGVHSARMEAKDGSFGFDFEGTYSEVDAPNAVTLDLEDGRKARTTFKPVVSGTLVETIFDAEDENSAEMQRDGWQAILNNYQTHVQQMAGVQ